MTRLYRLDVSAMEIAVALDADGAGDPWAGGAIAPGDYAPVVTGGPRRPRLVPRLWGVPPPPRGDHPVTHVRNWDSPFWIGTLRHTEFRCLVPFTRFSGMVAGRRVWLGVPGGGLAAFAGIWRDSEVPSFALLSAAGLEKGEVWPVILPVGLYHAWLVTPWKQAEPALRHRLVPEVLGER